MNFEVISEENIAIVDALVDGVWQFNAGQSVPLTVIARDENGKLIGGVGGRTIYKNFLINVVWVDDQTRGSGLGHKLMALAEAEAKQRGCLVAQVDTLSIQAPVFYEKQGVEIIGTVTTTPQRIFLMKKY
ncbi:GNAT family N-acetyltransferase [Shewanella sp. SM20]|uniref:GNAT family N-acetyltransferase n=1 Tax=Shewanella TaxID=22 RepID=UPI0021D831A8|nr:MULTISPECIES: GNAT family N-acetyltransferase [unclassified Shewanella]MCU7964388.1 GNAT family N-acetyltransferase [Shewanella sp. SW32]MCU7972292.1 GNAT family N-acetyltransferase [Shewanella sp. SW29]MCU8091786.1 GNAT family N-acetyltransferase [Shewanella sp. SM20]